MKSDVGGINQPVIATYLFFNFSLFAWITCPELIPPGSVVNPLPSVTACHSRIGLKPILSLLLPLVLSLSLPPCVSLSICSLCFCASVPVKKLLTSHSVWGWIEISHRVCTNMQRAHFDRCHQRTSIWITRQPAIFEFRQNGINTWLRSKQQHNNNMKAKATGSR